MKGIGLGELGIVVRWHLLYERGRRAHSFFHEFATRKIFPLVSLGKTRRFPIRGPDGKSIVFSQIDQWDRTIMLVNHFL
jgi:hypothetical protein